MEKHIRIYYESLEQGYHFILPAIERVLKLINSKIPIHLVRLKKDYKLFSNKLAPMIFWKNPDAIVTFVDGAEEYPLMFIEFSTAAFTEDHELQRFDGLFAAAEGRCTYIKISPLEKRSTSDHGGNINFDFIKPYSIIYKKYGEISFHVNWPVREDHQVIVDDNYISSPPKNVFFDTISKCILESIIGKPNNEWRIHLNKKIKNEQSLRGWVKEIDEYEVDEELELNSSRTKIVLEDEYLGENFLELKFNRFGHSMDPERGMLAFYGVLRDNIVSKMIFSTQNDSWYKGVSKEKEIVEYIRENDLRNPADYLYCFMLGSGLYNDDFFKQILKTKKTSKKIIIDITKFVNERFLSFNKALRIIFKFSRALVIEDTEGNKKVILSWSHKPKNILIEDQKITPLRELTVFDEDIVTYVSVHNILKPNNFIILAASYPGAQGDRKILPEAGTGRKQSRRYVDIVSYSPDQNITSLQENKGKFSSGEIKKCIEELSNYKTDTHYKEALKKFQTLFRPNSIDSIIKIGVGFCSSPRFTIDKIKNMRIDDLDYFVHITSDMKRWKIWSTGDEKIFSNNCGDVIIPEIFDIVE